MKFSWTDENVAILRECLDRKWSHSQIAKHLGCTRNASIGKAHRLGLAGTTSLYGPHQKGKTPKPRVRKAAGPKPVSLAASVVTFPIKRVEKPAPYVEGEGVALLDLEHHHCRWYLGPRLAVTTRFCGQPKRDHSPYCNHHHRMAYQPRGTVSEIRPVKKRKTGVSMRFEVARI